jgi:hypothetical protein
MKLAIALIAIIALTSVNCQEAPANPFAVVREEKVALKTHHGTYVRAHPGGEGSRVDIQTYIGEWEKFTLLYLQNGKVALRTIHNTYIRTHPGREGSKVDIQNQINVWETYDLIRNPNGTVSFRSIHGTYLRAHPGREGATLDTQTYLDAWEQYQLVSLEQPQDEVSTSVVETTSYQRRGCGRMLKAKSMKNL